MAACTFFGHRDCPDGVRLLLRKVILELIANHDVDMFYVGHQGRFDAIVQGVLGELKQDYSEMRYAVVLAYMPSERSGSFDISDTMLPEGIEFVHPHYAIPWRNKWMLQQSDFVVAYVSHSWGGASQYVQKAIRSGKTVINLYNLQQGGDSR